MEKRHHHSILSIRRLYLAFAFLLAACAGATVATESTSMPLSTARPNTIYVFDFAVTDTEVTLNQSIIQKTFNNMTSASQEQGQVALADQTAQALSSAMVQQLQELGFNAVRVPRGTPLSGQNVLLVDGQFLDINQGNRLRRMVIGLGAGQSTLDTQVQLLQMADGATKQLTEFTTHADSGSMPGAGITGPAGAAAGGAAAAASLGANLAAGVGKTYTSGMGFLAKKTADQSVAYLSQYFAAQGWIPQSQVRTVEAAPLPLE